MITNFFDSSLSNYWVKIKDTKQLLNKNRLSTELNQLAQTINAKLLLLYKKNYPQDKVRQITPQNELVELFARYDRTYQAFINNGSKI